MATVIDTEATAISPQATGKLFFAALAVVTFLPLAFLPFADLSISPDTRGSLLIAWILASYGHVLVTIWFGVDDEYQPVVREHRVRMIGALAFLPFGLAGVALMAPAVMAWVMLGYWVWQAHHFNRQNFGIISFAAAYDKMGPLPREIGWLLNITTAAGAINIATMPFVYGHLGRPLVLAALSFEQWRMLSSGLLGMAVLLAVWLIATKPALRASPTALLFLVAATLFFVPGAFGNSDITALWPYGIAHGLQYLFIMGVVGRGSRFGLAGIAIIAALAVTLGFAASRLSGASGEAFFVGLLMWHFLADARLWRLRDPMVRQVVKKRFAFVFS